MQLENHHWRSQIAKAQALKSERIHHMLKEKAMSISEDETAAHAPSEQNEKTASVA